MSREFMIGVWMAYSDGGEVFTPLLEHGGVFLTKREAIDDITSAYLDPRKNYRATRVSPGCYRFAVHNCDNPREVAEYYNIERVTHDNYSRLFDLYVNGERE